MDYKMTTHFVGNSKAQEFTEVNYANYANQLRKSNCQIRISINFRVESGNWITRWSVSCLPRLFQLYCFLSQIAELVSNLDLLIVCLPLIHAHNRTEESFQGAYASPSYRFWARPFYHTAPSTKSDSSRGHDSERW